MDRPLLAKVARDEFPKVGKRRERTRMLESGALKAPSFENKSSARAKGRGGESREPAVLPFLLPGRS